MGVVVIPCLTSVKSTVAKRLTAAYVRSAKPGRYYDEHGLMMRVLPTGARHWIRRGTVCGRRVDLGLGRCPYTNLAEARLGTLSTGS